MKKNYSSIRLEITSKCNLKCEYCHNSEFSNRKDDMKTEEILELITKLKEIYPINKILLTGGEPLINKDLYMIIKFISDLGIKADMVTNGTLLNQDVIKKLEKAGLKRIRLSIDELGGVSQLRSNTNPEKIWDMAKLIADISNIEVCIHTVCSPSNVMNLPLVYKKVLEVGAKRWRVFDLGYQGGIENNKASFNFDMYYDSIIEATKEILTHYISNNLKDVLDIKINNIFRTMMLGVEYSEFNVNEELKKRLLLSPCNYVTDHQLTIRSNGKATLCQYFRNTIFDFKRHGYIDVADAMCNEKFTYENNLKMEDLKYCSSCKYCLVCNSGCRSRANFITGDLKEPDPTACYLTSRICNEIIPILPLDVQKVYNSFIIKTANSPKYTRESLLELLHKRGY